MRMPLAQLMSSFLTMGVQTCAPNADKARFRIWKWDFQIGGGDRALCEHSTVRATPSVMPSETIVQTIRYTGGRHRWTAGGSRIWALTVIGMQCRDVKSESHQRRCAFKRPPKAVVSCAACLCRLLWFRSRIHKAKPPDVMERLVSKPRRPDLFEDLIYGPPWPATPLLSLC